MAAKQDEGWQLTKKTVLERNKHMFNNPLMSDIQFTCGDSKRKQFFAHKYVLATSSPVFQVMFYGDLAETKSVIHLPDTDDEAMEAFLLYLYTDKCTSLPELALQLIYLSAKYMVSSLTECCIEALKSNLSPENVFAVLQLAIRFNEQELVDQCWEKIDRATQQSLDSDVFLQIDNITLSEFLSRDTLTSSEVNLFRAITKWTEHQCKLNGFENDLANRRSLLGDSVYLIRFLLMPKKQFSEEIAPAQLLTDEEISSILDVFAGKNVDDFKWPITRKRSYFTRVSCGSVAIRTSRHNLFNNLAAWVSRKGSDDWRFQIWNTSYLRFKVDTPMVLHGIRLLGDADGSVYEVAIEIEGVGRCITGSYNSTFDESSATYGFNVMLPKTVDVSVNKFVGISVSVREPQSYYAVEKWNSVTEGDVSVTYEHQHTKRGDIYELILRMAQL